ncbi:nitroreductase [Nocardia mangyaensis]|uniref:Nitroreductase n=1 Tax=Nocardia mangyaensis TaxID=2213200 RepID=A0A1J0VKU8_9NOCA|nr:nitroreductase family deazaflavin-dependent oxidoreductase [Nocardia mangyaensis]APE32638.1 nitroreductase [Nocardia mangyaensis]
MTDSKSGFSALSLWFQRKMNERTVTKMRRKGSGKMMGMDVLILHTVGRRSGQQRQSPVSWFADGDAARLIVASGGGGRNPDWCANLLAHPDQVAIELPGSPAVAVSAHKLAGADRDRAWAQITTAQPRYEKYQRKSDREYPVIRLTEK